MACHDGYVTLQSEAEDLYGMVPEEFVAYRNTRAKEVRAAGDRELADQIRKLPKPRMSGWVLNMLVRRLPGDIDELLALGAEVRAAQADPDRNDVRALDRQRRDLTGALTRRARAIAGDLGHDIKDDLAAELESTLRTAMADPAGGAALRTGLLVDSFATTGFEPVEPDRVLAVPGAVSVPPPEPHLSIVREHVPAPKKKAPTKKAPTKNAPTNTTAKKPAAKVPRKRPDPGTRVRREAQAALQDAHDASEGADRTLMHATRSHADAVSRREDLESERTALQDRLRALETELIGAHHVEDKARREQERAEQNYTNAMRTVARAESRAARTATD